MSRHRVEIRKLQSEVELSLGAHLLLWVFPLVLVVLVITMEVYGQYREPGGGQ